MSLQLSTKNGIKQHPNIPPTIAIAPQAIQVHAPISLETRVYTYNSQ